MTKFNQIAILLLLIIFCKTSFAQEQLKHEKTIYQSSDGQLYWNRALPAYLWISFSKDSEKILLESKKFEDYVNPIYFDTEGPNFVRTRWAVNKETKKAIVPQQEITWPVIADGIAPVSSSSFKVKNQYYHKGKLYYAGNAVIKTTPYDKLSGVKLSYFSVDGSPFQESNGEIVISEPGEHTLKYYAVDNVGNVEKVKTKKFIIDASSPKTFHTIVGINLDGNIISTGTKIYLQSEESVSGIKGVYYKIDDKPYRRYNGKNVPTAPLKNGEHTLTYYSEDRVGNKEPEKSITFYLDKDAPILTSDVLGDRFLVGEMVYFSGRTKLKLTAVDNKSGVKKTQYSVNSGDYQTYSEPFYLPGKQGIHTVKYFAIDNTDNTTGKTKGHYNSYTHKVERIYVDLTGPTVKHQYIGKTFQTRDTVFINSKTKIRLYGSDKESGLQKLAYSIDGDRAETVYSKPFSVDISGLHKLEYFAYDNVNNRNMGEFFFFGDNEGPEIHYSFSIKQIGKKEGLDLYPNYVMMYVSATDATIGTQSIYYSLNGGAKKKLSSPNIEGFKKNEKNSITITAIDKLGNTSTKAVDFFVE